MHKKRAALRAAKIPRLGPRGTLPAGISRVPPREMALLVLEGNPELKMPQGGILGRHLSQKPIFLGHNAM